MKLPSLPKPKPTSATVKKGAKPQLRMPAFVDDLYRDMRDRRLLLPALLLIVAIVAVPVALSAPKEEPPAPLAYTPPEGSEAVAPAVLTEQPIGVRDYRERLDELKSKNPFASNFSFPKDGEPANGTGDGGAGTGTDPIAADPPPSGDTGDDPGIPNNDTGAPTGPGTPVDTPPDTTGGSDGTTGEILVLAPRIDVLAGPVGKRKRIEDVEIGDLLPDRREAPIAMFLGASENLKYANFLISADVTETTGEGQCRPRANACEFLRLRDNEKRYFTFGPDEERFSIKVTDIREKVVDRREIQD